MNQKLFFHQVHSNTKLTDYNLAHLYALPGSLCCFGMIKTFSFDIYGNVISLDNFGCYFSGSVMFSFFLLLYKKLFFFSR